MHERVSGISVFFPAFNDERTIKTLVTHALKLLPTLTDDFEIIVVNDGSEDATGEVLAEMARASARVVVVEHEKNLGYGAALRSGFSRASKELIFYTDGDGQYDVRELAGLLPRMTPACDVVNGYKMKRADSRRRVLIGALYNRLARLLFRLPIRDVDCDFRLIRRSAMRSVELTTSSGVICIELIYKLRASGSVFAEMPVQHYPRVYGSSQFFTLRRVAKTVYDFLVLWIKLVVFRRNTRPQP